MWEIVQGSIGCHKEAAMRRCREIDARWYATFHHKGIVEGFEATVQPG